MATRVVSFKASEDLVWLLDRIAEKEGLPRSEVIRRALAKYLYGDCGKRRVIATRKVRVYL